MTAGERAALLSTWIKPSSDNEAEQDPAERMVKDAIANWQALSGVSRRIYAKGSYANDNNRRDSDIDIVVECHDCSYYDFASGVTPNAPGGIAIPGPLESRCLAGRRQERARREVRRRPCRRQR
ncbi:MAG: nucleotidyltransferase domain-containing protein [Solirubrobacteraceae bacterium]